MAGGQRGMTQAQRCEVAAWILAAIGLVGVLQLHLLAALLAGLLAFELVEIAAARLRHHAGMRYSVGRIAALVILWLIIAVLVLLAVLGLLALLNDRSESLPLLMQKMADVVDTARSHLPDWAQAYLPSNSQELEDAAATWLRTHAGELQIAGEHILRMFVQILVGVVIGGMIALADYSRPRQLDADGGKNRHQIDRGQEGVERGDPDLGEDDAAKGMGEQDDAGRERRGQRTQLPGPRIVRQRDHAADHHAHQDLDEHAQD